jgi:hypothetical protein
VNTYRVSRVVYDTAALDWTPLERFLAAATERDVPAPSADEFMWMGRCELTAGPVVHLFKSTASRRYLNLDHAGFAYRYHPGDPGRYEPFESPLSALDDLVPDSDRDVAQVVAKWTVPTPRASSGPSLTL